MRFVSLGVNKNNADVLNILGQAKRPPKRRPRVVRAARLELATADLEGLCSIRLS